MRASENLLPENLRDTRWWLNKCIADSDKIGMLHLLMNALALAQSERQGRHEIIEAILEIIPEAGGIDPVETLEALNKLVLLSGDDYISLIAQYILKFHKAALCSNPRKTLLILENDLTICYCIILPKNLHGTSRHCNEQCIEWRRQIFLSIISAVEAKIAAAPLVWDNLRILLHMLDSMSEEFSDINARIKSCLRFRARPDGKKYLTLTPKGIA